jgi:hypothetical protein
VTATEIIYRYLQRGIILSNRAGRLHVKAPAGTLTEDDRVFLQEHRDMLLAVLLRQDPDGPTALGCPRCHGPTHVAEHNAPGLVTILCDDGERCRWGLAMSTRELAAWRETGIVPGTRTEQAS